MRGGPSGGFISLPPALPLRRHPLLCPAHAAARAQAADQVHGNDSVMGYMHEGTEPALRCARVLLEPASRTTYGLFHLGTRVCGCAAAVVAAAAAAGTAAGCA